MSEAVGERANRLQKTAKRAEAQVLQIRREERRLKLRCVELAEAVRTKKAEAEAALARRRALRVEVEQLRTAVQASEQADNMRLLELHKQVSWDLNASCAPFNLRTGWRLPLCCRCLTLNRM